MKSINLISILFVFIFLFSIPVVLGCGKKGPLEMIERAEKNPTPVENMNYQIQDDKILLKWEANYEHSIRGFDIFMSKQNINKCQGCPVNFIKMDSLSPNITQFQKDIEKGYRYLFKVITIGAKNTRSKDSEIIKIEFK